MCTLSHTLRLLLHASCPPAQPWLLWWMPLIKPETHYIPTTLADMPAKLAACKARPDGCQSIGEAARGAMRKDANPQVAKHYMYLVLKYIHDSQRKDLHAPAYNPSGRNY